MVVGESQSFPCSTCQAKPNSSAPLIVANFAAYTFAPAILVTPLGALSVLIGAVLASLFLQESLGKIGRVGCTLCLVGSIIIVLHAPEEKEVETVDEILEYAMHPGEFISTLQ